MHFQAKKWNQKRDTTRGTFLVELTATLPLLAILLLGVMELSVIVHNKSVITNASREGARYGIAAVGGFKSDDAIEQRVSNYVKDRLISFPSSAETTTVGRGGKSTPGQLRVRVVYPYQFLVLPELVASFTGPLTLGAETKMQME